MTRFLPVLFFLIVSTNSKSIESEKNVTKREANHEIFPDWVPFKNKHGDELGDFVTVAPKKVKKRLALPANFILKAVAAPQEDYGQGEGEGENYYEKTEWADPNRNVPSEKPENHTTISEIDSIVTILNNPIEVVTPKVKAIHRGTEVRDKNPTKAPRQPKSSQEDLNSKPKSAEYNDYEDTSTEKQKPETNTNDEEQNEEAAKRSSILDSVDELKERHAEQQKFISEKAKEEAMYKEERDSENGRIGSQDKYSRKDKSAEYDEYYDASVEDKYKISPIKKQPLTTTSTVAPTTRRRSQTTKPRRVESGKLSVFRNPGLYVVYDDEPNSETPTTVQVGKYTTESSRAHALFDSTDNLEIVTETERTTRFSSRITTEPTVTKKTEASNENVRISLVPDEKELKEGEPTMFFPKKRKNKRRRISNFSNTSTRRPEKDSSVAASDTDKELLAYKLQEQVINDSIESNNATSPSATDETGPSGSVEVSGPAEPSGAESTGPSEPSEAASVSQPAGLSSPSGFSSPSGPTEPESTGTEEWVESGVRDSSKDSSASAASAPVAIEPEAASSDHKKGEENYEHEKGGQREHHSEHQSEHGESGKKAYEGHHKDTKAAKGHHDKEDHLGSYDDHGGVDKHHHNEKKHYGAHHHEEHGKKHAKYEESGKHSKGHSTKGSHDIHKKEEYEKKVEFFEEEGDSAEEEKHGGHHEKKEHSSGGHFKKGNLNAGHHDHEKGDAGFYKKGAQGTVHKGHGASGGHDSHGKHSAGHFTKSAHDAGKKWIYHHGFPAKNANLVIIDRRADQLYHGPQYFG